MDQKYNISEILDAVNELSNHKFVKEKIVKPFKELSNDGIPPSTLKLIEEAEKNNI